MVHSASSPPTNNSAGSPVDARSVAVDALVRVLRDDAFAAAALEGLLTRNVQLDVRERALATELVYGTLRVRLGLEAELARQAPRGLGGLDREALAHALIASYQIIFSDRIPAFAAVNEAVARVSSRRDKKLGGFVNAMLRRIVELRDRDAAAQRGRIVRAATPPWLKQALARTLGAEGAAAFMLSAFERAPLALRARQSDARDALHARLSETYPDGSFVKSPLSPYAIIMHGAGAPSQLEGYERDFVVQEEGSQLIALALDAKPGERVLDACAGRGNKTLFLGDLYRDTVHIEASDLHPQKLERLAIQFAANDLPEPRLFAVDWTAGVGEAADSYDAILLDAPCSGIGTLRRRPDILLRRDAATADQLGETQRAILRRVAGLLKPGGRLIYAVCSILREEAEDVCEPLVAELGLRPMPFTHPSLSALAGTAASVRLLPATHGTDGYFLASFEKCLPLTAR